MANELKSSQHSVSECNLHIQLTPAYRRRIFQDKLVRELTGAYLMEKAKSLGIKISALDFGPDHAHIFVRECIKYAPCEIVRQLKGYSSYKMRRGHGHLFNDALWGDKFWSGGYFCRTVGVVTAETVRKYIEEGQKKHWEDKNQTTLINYSC
jgi:putative transposase